MLNVWLNGGLSGSFDENFQFNIVLFVSTEIP